MWYVYFKKIFNLILLYTNIILEMQDIMDDTFINWSKVMIIQLVYFLNVFVSLVIYYCGHHNDAIITTLSPDSKSIILYLRVGVPRLELT